MTPRSDAPGPATAARRRTIYSTPSDRELVITRTFDAPRSLVWSAFTEPRHVRNWQTGPNGFTMLTCEIDLRAGGAWRYVWQNAHGREFGATGTYREVEPPGRIVYVTDRDGGEQTNTTTFTEENGSTTVTSTLLFPDKASRDKGLPLAKLGTDSNYAHLDGYLTSLNNPPARRTTE